MKYRDRTTGQIYGLFELQQKFSHVSFPNSWDSSTYDFANVDPVTEVYEPIPHVHNRFDYGGVQLVNGVWTDVWIEVPKFDDLTEQADWIAECLETQWNTVRGQRNSLLEQTDYTVMSDLPITAASRAEFVTYRQALRDIHLQLDPYNIVWPILPIYVKE